MLLRLETRPEVDLNIVATAGKSRSWRGVTPSFPCSSCGGQSKLTILGLCGGADGGFLPYNPWRLRKDDGFSNTVSIR